NSLDNLPAIVRWLSISATVDLSNQDLNKVYPYEEESVEESEVSEEEAVPEAADLAPIRGGHSVTDVAEHWAEEDIQWAYERGIVNGVGDGRFQPDGTTTEEQFLKMLLISMKGLTEEPVSSPWSQKYYDFALDYD